LEFLVRIQTFQRVTEPERSEFFVALSPKLSGACLVNKNAMRRSIEERQVSTSARAHEPSIADFLILARKWLKQVAILF
jgi:hypothetical protein